MYGWQGRARYAQFDGLLILPEAQRLCIVEVKYQHTAGAYWQLEHLYIPLLRCFLGPGNPWQIATVEVCKWYDPSTRFPIAVNLCEDVIQARVGTFNVHILNR